MESQFRPGFDGTMGGAGGHIAGPPASSSSSPVSYILRVMAIVLTFISTVMMGTAKEIVIFIIVDSTTGASTSLSVTVKSTYSAGYVYFVIANAVVFFYSVVSLVISIAKRAGTSSTAMALAIADLVMALLLFSGNGAAAAISLVAENGQQNLAGWDKICDAASKFCARVNAAIALSMLASVAYVVLIVFGMIALRKKSY